MKQKDFSEICTLLKTNGVGFIKCFFRSSLYPEDLMNHPVKDWRIDFSDGVRYLGSLITDSDVIGFSSGTNILSKNKEPMTYTCHVDPNHSGYSRSVTIEMIITAFPLQGECIIQDETTELTSDSGFILGSSTLGENTTL